VLDLAPQQLRQPLERVRRGPDAFPAVLAVAVESPAVSQDAHRLEAQLLCEAEDCVLLVFDQVRATLGMLTVGEPVAQGPHAAADAIARLDDRHVGAVLFQHSASHQPRQPGARDDDLYAPHPCSIRRVRIRRRS
jgi:hypothetical protein